MASLLCTDGMSFFQLEEMCWSGRGGFTDFDFDGMLRATHEALDARTLAGGEIPRSVDKI